MDLVLWPERLAWGLLLIVVCGSWSCARRVPALDRAPLSPRQTVREFPLGDSTIRVLLHQFPGSSLLWFNPHDDENTAAEAALQILRRRGGTLVEFQEKGERLLSFQLEGVPYRFDPNRMFTDSGARKTLETHGHFSPQALQQLRRFAQTLLRETGLDQAPVLLTVHNNTAGNYSALSYLPGGPSASDAAAVQWVKEWDPDDFFFVTDRELYFHFARLGFNVVLQDNATVTDDGSLSVLAARRQVPYINVEARHGHLEQQRRMLEAVYDRLETIVPPAFQPRNSASPGSDSQTGKEP